MGRFSLLPTVSLASQAQFDGSIHPRILLHKISKMGMLKVVQPAH